MVPRVVDISHYTTVSNFKKTANAGIWGIICKCTQGISMVDGTYLANRDKVWDAGMLWGAYHFATGHDPKKQVDHFLAHAAVDDRTLPCLDFEKNPSGTSMNAEQMLEFLSYGERKIGRKFCIYSGNFLKEQLDDLSVADQLYICDHKLWLAQYSSLFKLPTGFTKYFLWQYTGDGMGPEPHTIPGLGGETGGLDLNVYDGTREQLIAEWTVQKPVPVVVADNPPSEPIANTPYYWWENLY